MESLYRMAEQTARKMRDVYAKSDQYATQATEQSVQVDILAAKVDLLLAARIKDGSLTADMVQASALPEAAKTELTGQIAAEKVASTT